VATGNIGEKALNCKCISSSETDLKRAANALCEGRLVAFPTETVYGLGAAISHEEALRNVFSVKGRPFHDPLIIHITSLEMCEPYLNLSPSDLFLVETLAAAFWPGPLTLVLPAAEQLSRLVTGGGATVGVRFPAHPIAQKIIAAAGVPIAAPSANRFGHVSPTCARHVEEDLGDADIYIVDGGSCAVGIESTVAKICGRGLVEVLRPGLITQEALQAVLEPIGVGVSTRKRQYSEDAANQEAPGQLLKHYAPHVNAYIWRSCSDSTVEGRTVGPLSEVGLIDFFGTGIAYADSVAQYMDLSKQGSLTEACHALFGVLRMMESHPKVRLILMPDLGGSNDSLAKSLFDRIERACCLRHAVIRDCSVLAVV
jgi:tRNA threonylcarbamoyl adenosine modification protein (Sua5/YciO/YrdC/YwlC family)